MQKKKHTDPEPKKSSSGQRRIAKLQASVKGKEDWKPLGQLLKELNPKVIRVNGKMTWRRDPLPLNSAPKEAPQDSTAPGRRNNNTLTFSITFPDH